MVPLGARDDELDAVEPLDRRQGRELVLALFDAAHLQHKLSVDAELGKP